MGDTSARALNLLGRRLASAFYDGLIAVALAIFATALLLPATGGEAIPSGSWGYRIYLLGIMGGFFALSWSRGGQTPGMRAWRLRVTDTDGSPIGFFHASGRYLAAWVAWLPLAAGVIWMLVDREHLAWHDRISGTRVDRIDSDDGRSTADG